MKRTHWAAVFLLLTALGWVSAQSADKKRKTAPKATSKTEKSAKNADRRERPGRPPFEVTTLTGTLSFSGESEQTATVTDADGKTTALKVLDAPERKGDRAPNGKKSGFGKNGAPNGNARPPLPADTNGARKQPPKPVTLDDLKKLDGKSVEVKGALDKDGNLLVFAATNLQSE